MYVYVAVRDDLYIYMCMKAEHARTQREAQETAAADSERARGYCIQYIYIYVNRQALICILGKRIVLYIYMYIYMCV